MCWSLRKWPRFRGSWLSWQKIRIMTRRTNAVKMVPYVYVYLYNQLWISEITQTSHSNPFFLRIQETNVGPKVNAKFFTIDPYTMSIWLLWWCWLTSLASLGRQPVGPHWLTNTNTKSWSSTDCQILFLWSSPRPEEVHTHRVRLGVWVWSKVE